jgi:hypothetical protein
MPSNWELFMCDINRFYTASVEKCPSNSPSIIAANSKVIFMYHFIPDSTQGIGKTWIELFSDKTFKTKVAETHVNRTIKIGSLSSSEDQLTNAEINIFPNPATQSFFIKQNDEISSLSIFDFMGKELISYEYSADKSYDIAKLLSGIYIIKFSDKKGKNIGVKMLSKI